MNWGSRNFQVLEIDNFRDELVAPLEDGTLDFLAAEPPAAEIPDANAGDISDYIRDVLILRSCRQRLALLSLSGSTIRLPLHALESYALYCAVDSQVDALTERLQDDNITQLETQRLKSVFGSLAGIYDRLRRISERHQEKRVFPFMRLPVGQQLAVLERFLPPPKNPAGFLTGAGPKKEIDLRGVIPEAILSAVSLVCAGPVIQDYGLKAIEDDDGARPIILHASIKRIPAGDCRNACKCRPGNMLDAYEVSHDDGGNLVPPLAAMPLDAIRNGSLPPAWSWPAEDPVWVLDYLIVEPGYEEAAAPCLRWFIENVIKHEGPLLVYPVLSSLGEQGIRHDDSPEALGRIRGFYASMNFLPLPGTDHMYLNT
jgi:hypothetical protein